MWSACTGLSDKKQLIRDRIEKDSTNSSKPPSSDSLAAKIERYRENHNNYVPTGKKQGAQTGHKGYGRDLVSDVTKVITCPVPDGCGHCGGLFVGHEISRRKQVSYLKDKQLTVTEFQVMKARCQACRRICRGELPPGTPKGAFGSCILSIITMLTGRYRLSKHQVKACLHDLFGLKVSVGTISNIEKEVSESLSDVTQEVHAALKSRNLIHVDETSHYHKHRLHWLWVLADKNLAYICLYRYRNGEMARCLLGEIGGQNWVTDRYSAYSFLPKKQHQYCWSHLKRDIKSIIDHPEAAHASLGNRLEVIRSAVFKDYRHWQESPFGSLLSRKMKGHLREFHNVLREGLQLEGKKTASFCRNLTKNWRKMWNFLLNPLIPPTNNHAERMIRHNVLWRKLSLGTQSNRGDRYVERMSTVQLSCRLQRRDLQSFLESALDHFWSGQDPPSLLAQP